jgi:hypothetical protein
MAELDFKHSVSEIPKGESLPASPGRKVNAEVSKIPDFQGAVNKYAEDTNWMSQLGSAVATRASNAVAQKIGGELGKNPQGNIGPVLTNFDKVMSDSYNTQAQATLGLQAHALITKSNIELAQQPRLDASMIASTQQSNMKGLQKILALAPDSVRPHMESQYGSVLIDQNATLINRMTGEQKTDRVDKATVAAQTNNETSHSLAVAGDEQGALAFMNATIKAAKADAARHDISEEEAKVRIDTARQTYYSGNLTRYFLEEQKKGKLNEAMDSVKKDPEKHGISDVDHKAVINNALDYMAMQERLGSLQERHTALEMHNRIVQTGGEIPGSEWATFKESVSPNVEAQMRINLTTAQQKANKKINDTAAAIKNVTSFNDFNNNTNEQNFDALVELSNKKISSAADKGNKLEEPEAMMQTAAGFAGPVKKFIDTLNTKASSGDPLLLQEVDATIKYMTKAGAAQNLAGISDDTYAVVAKFNSLSSMMDPVERGQIAKDQVYNKKSEQNIANDAAWKNLLTNRKKSGQSDAQYALSVADIEPDSIVNVPLLSKYVLDRYETIFKKNNGDEHLSQDQLKEDIGRTFGTTYVNGKKEFTMYPVEASGNLPPNSAPFIQEDMRNQVSKKLVKTKEIYDAGDIDFYFEMNPTVDLETALASHRKIRELQPSYGSYKLNHSDNPKHEVYLQQRELLSARENIDKFTHGESPKITQHFRDGHKKEYELIIQPNQSLGVNSSKGRVGNYDIKLRAGNSTTPLILADPRSGPPIYKPNFEDIKKNFLLLQYYLPPDLTLKPDVKRQVENLQKEYINPKI